MKTFPHWRSVGRAMFDARRREGVTVTRHPDAWHGYEWDRGSADLVSVHTGQRGCSLMVDLAGGRHLESGGMDATSALRVLAALDLIPADIAYAADERYGRCVKCGRLAQWVPAEGQFAARWCHLDPTRPYHKPEVAT